jgi:hypothetical protein
VKPSHTIRPVFDDPNLVSAAGLVPALRLAESAGFHDLLGGLSVPAANAGAKAASVVGGMLAGADSIDDLDLLRHGGMVRLFGGVRAPSTLGTFLRSFTHGHVQQLDKIGDLDSDRGTGDRPRPAPGGQHRLGHRRRQVVGPGHQDSPGRWCDRTDPGPRGLGLLRPRVRRHCPAPQDLVLGDRPDDSHRDRGDHQHPDARVAAHRVPQRGFRRGRAGRRKAEHVACRLVVRRVKRLQPLASGGSEQGELFATYRHHAFITNSTLSTIEADQRHRDHALVEQVIAELKDGPLAHLPSGRYTANAAWVALAVIAFDIARATAVAAAMRTARWATVRTRIINVPARIATTGRRLVVHLPTHWAWSGGWELQWSTATSPPLTVTP